MAAWTSPLGGAGVVPESLRVWTVLQEEAALLFGLLNINKPAGLTSRDVVNRVQRLTGRIKLGHAGTLDPLATGVLVVCVGRATRLVPYIQNTRKRYLGTFLLGESSDTDDILGQRVRVPGAVAPDRSAIETVLPQFIGTIEQRPPAYSAIKVQGQRAYARARRGEEFVLAPRPVTIDALEVLDYEYPRLVLDVTCGSGTYLRSLGRDIGLALGTGGVMAELCRTCVGPFDLEQACVLDALTAASLPTHLQPPLLAVAHLPRMVVDGAQREALVQGRAIVLGDGPRATEVVAVEADGRLLAILEPAPGEGLRPIRVFA